MNKPTLISIYFFMFSFASVQQSYGFPEVVFSANLECESVNTSKGIRYIPPCDINTESIFPETNNTISNDSYLIDALLKSTIKYSFICDSLRPVSLLFQLLDGETIVEQENTAGTTISPALVNTFTHSIDSASFQLVNLDVSTGIQAIRPGCMMTVNSFFSYPEPNYFRLLAESQINIDTVFRNLIQTATPDITYATAVGNINNGILILNFLQSGSDLLTQLQIEATIIKLQESIDILTNNCQADSGTSLCSEAIAETREAIQAESFSNDQRMLELQNYLESQTQWLNSRDVEENDLHVLTETYEQISNQLGIDYD